MSQFELNGLNIYTSIINTNVMSDNVRLLI